MNQDDFRRLVASGGADGGGGSGKGYGGKRNLTDGDLEEIKRLSKKPKKKGKKPSGQRQHKGNSRDDGEDGEERPDARSSYRDRAAERRKGGTSGMIDADEFAHLDAEQTKFLGGDLEHTHLVKGLDFALLKQLKHEKEKLLQVTAGAKQQQQQQQHPEHGTSKSHEKQGLTFNSRMGRLVYFHACQSGPAVTTGRKSLVKSELFLPGRMDYTFNLSEVEVESIPVNVQRSKEDCPEPDDVVSGIVDEALIERIGELLVQRQSGKKLRKKKRDHHGDGDGADDAEESALRTETKHEVTETPTAAVEDDSDEDIFADVGDYVPVDQRVDEVKPSASDKTSIKSQGYFSNLSASISASEAAAQKKEEEAEHAWKATLQKAVEAQAKKEQEEAQKAKAAKLAAMTSEYDEYYQGAGTYEDSDEDEEGEAASKRRKAKDDAEVSETEKGRRKQQKQTNKLTNDLEKINKIMETKQGSE